MVNRDRLIAYLLHEMPEAEREDFSARVFSEPDLYEEVRMAEADLLDDYARNAVSGERRERIERCLLCSPAQREKLEFARALAATLPRKGRHRLNLGWMAAAAAIVVLATASLLLAMRVRHVENEMAKLQEQIRSRAQVQAVPGGVFSVLLPAAAVRGSSAGASFHVPRGAAVIRLELELESGEQPDLALLSASGRQIWRGQPVRTGGQGGGAGVETWIPAGLLSPGVYTIKLESNEKPVAYYEFTLLP